MRQATRLFTATIVAAAVMVLAALPAQAIPSNFDLQCSGPFCHAGNTNPDLDDNATCSGCHVHVSGQLVATTDKTVYSPGETVTVTLSAAGIQGGWIRAMLYDQLLVELDRVTGPTGTGDDGVSDPTLSLPVVLSGAAPLAEGTYTWAVGWYGSSGAPGSEFPHMETLVDTNEFQVGAGGTTTTTTTVPGTTTTIPGTTTTVSGSTTTTVTTPPTTTTLPPAEGLDHFVCYRTTTVRDERTVTLADQFDSGSYEVKRANTFCVPANKFYQGENTGIADPDTHLLSYRIRGPHVRRTKVEVANQFGTFLFDTKRTSSLLVPTAKSIAPNPPPGLPNPDSLVDHYRCVKARTSRGTEGFPRGISVEVTDQFGVRNLLIKRPLALCVPTDKNGEAIKDPDAHLMCYKAKPDLKHPAGGVQLNNQFGEAVLTLRKEVELCVPSTKGEVLISVDVSPDPVPDAALTATATVDIGDGSTLQSIEWTLETEVPGVAISGETTASAVVTLPARSVYRDHLIHLLNEPPVSEDELPPNVPLPPGEFPGGLPDRFQVVGANPFALEEVGVVHLEVAVTTTSGTYTEDVTLHTELPWKVSTGLRDVPVGIPVVLHGKDGITPPYDWTLASKPALSTATLIDPTLQSPEFTPDVQGLYVVTVTDTTQDPDEEVSLKIFAGTWVGAITGQDGDGRPLAANCVGCHNDSYAADLFTPWAQTGHAEILTNNLNTSTHYGPSCFPCHTVGYEPGVDNGGVDDAADYDAFLASGLLNNPGDNWTTMLASYPASARLSNIQCENCHGPQSGGAHIDKPSKPRVSLSSDVCGSCHGEPLRHARFQQWQLSGHANYELAIDESGSGDCSRCHTANGFLAWVAEGNDPGTSVTVSWTEDEAHPQTCQTCHDPHNVGTTTGTSTDAPPRITGDTPPLLAGFTATDVGRGAICMTCHNSRRGLRNDAVFDSLSASDRTRAPHAPAQTDVLMGQNAYLVPVGTRGFHSLTAVAEDTCVTCHMVATPPPAALAYNLGGTNHTFFASPDICSECHSGVGAADIQLLVDSKLEQLEELIAEGILEVMAEQIAATLGNYVDLNGLRSITDTAEVQEIQFTESRGRQAIIVTFTDAEVVGPVRVGDIVVRDSSNASLGTLYELSPDDLVKSGWNVGLIHNDRSRGVHNPAFVLGALDASIAALTP